VRGRSAAAIGIGRVDGGTRLDVDAGVRRGLLEQRGDRILALGGFDRTGELALAAADAPLGIDEYGLHHTFAPW
jgi:hypothetical protein